MLVGIINDERHADDIKRDIESILSSLRFVESYQVKIKIDKDGLYGYNDKLIIKLKLNHLYTAHVLMGGDKIDIALRKIIPITYDLVIKVED